MNFKLKTIIPPFLLSRAFCFLWVYLGHAQREFLKPVPGGWEGVAHWWLNPWTTYDSKWFMSVAQNGYAEHTTPFFPLYPLLLRLGGDTDIGMAFAGFVVSNIFFLLSLNLFYLLSYRDFGDQIAKSAVWLLAFFPTTAFFSAVYSESLFLFLLLGSFYFAREKSWRLAGLFGFFAALTRNPGFLIFIALIIEYLNTKKHDGELYSPRELCFLMLPLAGFLATQAFFGLKFDSPLAGINSQSIYFREIGWPWIPIWGDLSSLAKMDGSASIDIILIVGAIFLILYFIRELRFSYFVIFAGIMMMHLIYHRYVPPYTVGGARYLSTIFPFTQLGTVAFNKLNSRQIKNIFFIFLLVITAIFSFQFGCKSFLG